MKTQLFLKKQILLLFVFLLNANFYHSQTLLDENFTGTALPTGWQIQSTPVTSSEFTWSFYDTYNDVEVYERNGDPQNELLISPPLDLSTASNIYANFKLYLLDSEAFITDNTADIKILISVNNGSWTELWNDAQLAATDFVGIFYYFRNIPVSLSSYCLPGNTNVRLALKFTSTGTGPNYGAQAYLLGLKVSSDCPIPTLRTFNNDEVTWFSLQNFSGTYDLKFTNAAGVETLVTGLTGNSYNIGGNKCSYGVQIRANCGGNVSAWSEVGTKYAKTIASIQNNFSTNTNTITWTGNASGYDIEYGPKGFAHGNGILVENLPESNYSINGIFPCTDYQYYIRTNCGNGDVGAWTAVQNFNLPVTAALSPLNPTFTENFDKKLCEIGYASSLGDLNASGLTVNNTLQMVGTTSARRAIVMTRGVTLTAGIPYKISFKSMKYNTNALIYNPSLKVGSSNDYLSHTPLHFFNPTSNTTFSNYSKIFVPTTTGTYYFSFEHLSSSTQISGIIIDDFKINACVAEVTNSNVTYNSATLNVIKNCDTYDVEYGPYGFTQGNGILLNDVTDNSLQINNLMPCSTYTAYIRPKCGGIADSWTAYNFSTTFNPSPANIPYTADFNTTACAMQWTMIPGANGGFYTGVNGGSLAVCINPNLESKALSRGLNLVAGKTYILNYKYTNTATGNHNLKFSAGQSTDIATHSVIQNYSNLPVTLSGVYNNQSFEFSVPATGVYYIGITATGNYSSCAMRLDDFQIQDKLLSTNENSKAYTQIYPNPVKEVIHIVSPHHFEKAEIYDASGRKIVNQEITENKINVAALAKGKYILILTGKEKEIFNFIKE